MQAEADLEIRDRIPQLRRWHYPGEDLPLVVQACRFRGHRGQIRLEFFFELPGPEIARYATSQEKGFVGEKRLLVVDARGRRRGPRIENVAYPLPKQDEAGSALPPVDAMWTDVKPGRNAVAMAVEEWRSRVRFTWRDTLEVGSLQDHGLAMSDIVFARSVERERGERVSGSTRGDLVVIPHPATTFHQDESAFFYCEVYGLTPADTSGTCDYRLEYRIEEVTTDGKGKRSFLTRWLRGPAGGEPRSVLYRFDRRSSASDAQDYVAIDPGAFAQGLYRITFTATDTNGGGTASRSAEFRVAD
jgi:hypothetical protein